MDKNVAVAGNEGFLEIEPAIENDFKSVFQEDLSRRDIEDQILAYERFGY